jgi:uncharacterized protein
MAATPRRQSHKSPWRHRASAAGVLLLFLLWLCLAAPLMVTALRLGRDPGTNPWGYAIMQGALAVAIAALFTARGTWRANGFLRGFGRSAWIALWPSWVLPLVFALPEIDTHSSGGPLPYLVYCSLIGFTEEAIFRGALFRSLLPGGARSAMIWSSVWFGILHVGYFAIVDWRVAILMVLTATAFGFNLAWVRWASASIWPGAIVHAFVDCAAASANGAFHPQYSPHLAVTSGILIAALLSWTGWLMTREVAPGTLSAHVINPFVRRRDISRPIEDGGEALL